MVRYNLHTHSFYCGHGSGRISEYCGRAAEKGFDALGFSEHIPFPDGRLSRSRMAFGTMPVYEADVRSQHVPFRLLLGYEVDYFPELDGYYEEVFGRVDYLIGGTHFITHPDGTLTSVFEPGLSKKDLGIYAGNTIKAMESGLFSFYAHPDVFLAARPFDDEAKAVSIAILDAAADLGMPFEINGNGIMQGRGYPSRDFWALAAERGIPALLSTDAHSVPNLDASFEAISEFAAGFGIDVLYPEDGLPLSFRTEQGRRMSPRLRSRDA